MAWLLASGRVTYFPTIFPARHSRQQESLQTKGGVILLQHCIPWMIHDDTYLFTHCTATLFHEQYTVRAMYEYVCIYDPGSRFATTPPPPHGMVPKPAFCSIPHENVVFAVFFAWWVAGAVRNPANSLDFCNQPSETVLFAIIRLRHRGVIVPPCPLLFLCQIFI